MASPLSLFLHISMSCQLQQLLVLSGLSPLAGILTSFLTAPLPPPTPPRPVLHLPDSPASLCLKHWRGPCSHPGLCLSFAFSVPKWLPPLVRELLTLRSASPVLDSRPSRPLDALLSSPPGLTQQVQKPNSSCHLHKPASVFHDSASHALASMPSTPPSR